MENNLIQDLSKITKKLLINDPFYGLFCTTIAKKERKDIPLAAVGINRGTMDFTLFINPDEWFKYSDEAKFYVMLHEMQHLTNFHLITAGRYSNQRLDNIACDIGINQTVGKANLPSWGCFIEDFREKYPDLNWAERAGREHYYNELNKLPQKEKEELGIDDRAEHIWIVIDADGDVDSNGELTEAEINSIRVQLEGTIETIAEEVRKSFGSIPNEINTLISGFKKPKPVFDYKKFVRNFVGNSTKYYLKTTKLKENPRFPGQPKVVLKPKHKLGVFIDFSGSVSNTEAFEFLNEIAHLSKKTDLEIHSFDTKVYPEVKYKAGSNDFPRQCNGGTDLSAPVNYFDKRKDLHTAIIFTDGHFSPIQPSSKNTLVVISSKGTSDNVNNFKNVIKIPPADN
jgi:predicted metal-dependent peptidase